MALNTQKLLPGSGSKTKSALAVIPKVKSSLVSVNKTKIKTKEKDSPLVNILKKTILINKTLEQINEQLIKQQNAKRRESILAKRKGQEDRLEGSDKKKKKKGKSKEPSTQLSFLDRIKRFLTYTFLGWLFDKTVKYLPQLLKIVEVIGTIGEFLANVFGTIGNALAIGIDKAYEFWDNFKAWKKENIDGTNFEKFFNPIINNLETFANLALIAGLIAATSGGGSNDRGRGGSNNRRRGGNTRTRGRGVTGSNTRPRPRGRGFFRRRPRITGTGRDRLFRNPFRRKPKPTGTRGYRIQQTLDKLNPLRKKAPVTRSRGTRIRILQDQIKNLNATIANQAKRISQLTKSGVDVVAKQAPKIASKVKAGADVTFDAVKSAITKGKFTINQLTELAKPILSRVISSGKAGLSAARTFARPILAPFQRLVKAIPVVGLLIDFGINTFIFGDSPDKAAFKAVAAAIFSGIAGAAGAAIGGPPGAWAAATVGGILGDKAGGALYDMVMGKGKTVTVTEEETITYKSTETRVAGEIYDPENPTEMQKKVLKMRDMVNQNQRYNKGGTIGKRKITNKDTEIRDYKEPLLPPLMGSLQSQKIFPIATQKGYQSPQEFLKKSIKTMRKTPYYGHIFNFFGESILGKRLSFRDIDNIGISISSLISKIFKEELEDGKSFYDIIRNLPGLIYKLTHNELLKRNNKIVSNLSIQSNLKTIYDDSLVKKIRDLEDQLKKERERQVNAPASSPSPTSSPSPASSPSPETVPQAQISSLGSGGGSLKNMTDQDFSDLAYIVSHEALRNTDDEYAVAAAVLNRVTDPRYPNTIMGVGTAPGQFEAVFKGRAYRDPKLAEKLKANQDKIISALKKLDGRTDFKAFSSMGQYMGNTDIMFAPNGNFYHYAEQVAKSDPIPNNIPQHWKKLLGEGLKGGGDIIKTREPRSFKSLKRKTSYENSMVILVKREKEIVYMPINNSKGSSIIVNNNNSLSSEKFNSFIR